MASKAEAFTKPAYNGASAWLMMGDTADHSRQKPMRMRALSVLACARWPAASQISYLAAHFCKSQIWHASTLLFAFFLTEICMIGAAAMGVILAASLALNGLIDAVLGRRWSGRRVGPDVTLHLQVWGAAITGLFFFLFCATPMVGMAVRPFWALAMLLGFRASYPLIDVAQNALVAQSDLTDDQRFALLAWRNVVSGLAAVTVAGVVAPVLVRMWNPMAWLIWAAGIAGATCGTAWWLTRYRTVVMNGTRTAVREPDPSLSFVGVLAALVVLTTAVALFRTLEPYYSAFTRHGGDLMLWAAIGGIASQPLWLSARRRVPATGTLILMTVVAGVAGAGLLWPAAPGVVLAGLGFGIATGGLSLILWAAMMNHAAGGRATGYVGSFTAVSKLSQATAMLVLGRALTASSYRTTLADPHSPVSVLMVLSIVAIGGIALVLVLLPRVSRTGCDETRGRRRQEGRQDRGPERRRRALLPVPVDRGGPATAALANRPPR